MSVLDCCSTDPVTARARESIREAAIRMDQQGVGCLIVVDAESRPAGIVTDRDLVMRGMRRGCDPDDTPLSDVMEEDVVSIREDAQLMTALRSLRRHGLRRLAVVDVDGHLTGVLTADDALQVIAAEVTAAAAAVRSQFPAQEVKS